MPQKLSGGNLSAEQSQRTGLNTRAEGGWADDFAITSHGEPFVFYSYVPSLKDFDFFVLNVFSLVYRWENLEKFWPGNLMQNENL